MNSPFLNYSMIRLRIPCFDSSLIPLTIQFSIELGAREDKTPDTNFRTQVSIVNNNLKLVICNDTPHANLF